MKQIAIVGLGLMGGSLAKALQQKTLVSITAIDQKQVYIDQAMQEGIIQFGTTDINKVDWGSFDYIIFSTPVEETLRYMLLLEGKISNHCIVTDLGSTKTEILKLAEGLSYSFIGGHPMVGSEKNGYTYAKAHLYENAYYVLSPLKSTSIEKLDKLKELITTIGSVPIEISPQRHDLVTAVISHVPHVVASTLVHLINDYNQEKDIMYRLAAGGFKDITRIASSEPNLWKQITINNRIEIIEVLDQFINRITSFTKKLKHLDEHAVDRFFTEAKQTRDQFKETIDTDIPKQFFLIVDIEDRPGMIAKISTLLFEQGINIKNIGIIHNREFENGCLKIIFESKEDQRLAYQHLQEDYLAYLK